MGFHTFPTERADQLEDPSRYRYCSLEELVYALDLDGTELVVDLGVGTGFFAGDVAGFARQVVGVDLQRAMAERAAARSVDGRLDAVIAAVEALPLRSGVADVAYSTMTFHEYATPAAHASVRRVLGDGGRVVTVDWSASGAGSDGPPLDERYDLAEATDQLQSAGFRIERAESRQETMLLTATVG